MGVPGGGRSWPLGKHWLRGVSHGVGYKAQQKRGRRRLLQDANPKGKIKISVAGEMEKTFGKFYAKRCGRFDVANRHHIHERATMQDIKTERFCEKSLNV